MKRLLLPVLALVLALGLALPMVLPASAAIATITLESDTETLCAGYTTTNPYGIPNSLDPSNYDYYSANGVWNDAVAVDTTGLIPTWWYDNSLLAPAIWISSEDPRAGTIFEDQWRLFKEEFEIPAGSTNISGSLDFTADNAVAVYLNGNLIAITPPYTETIPPFTVHSSPELVYGPSPYNSFDPQYHQGKFTCGLAPQVGTNTLMFVVRNWGWPYGGNPTGLLYKGEVEYEEAGIQQAPDIEIVKTVYTGYDGGISCPGGDVVTGDIGDEITYCFTVTNTGDTYLKDVTVTDPDLFGAHPIGVLPPSPNPGYSVSFYYETTILGNLLNTARVVGTPCDQQGVELGLDNVNHHDHAAVGVCEPCGSQETCETAFAYGGPAATCFRDIAGLGTNRWGWTNGPLGDGPHSFPIYAGVGQCDISNSTAVGNITIVYDEAEGTATVNYYITESGCGMEETHLYVGSEILPRNNGEFTTAPGQYTEGHDLDGATTDTYVIEGLSGPIYVVAHAVVCCDISE